MKHTVRTVAFFLTGAVALVAQTPVDNQAPASVQLMALNTTKIMPYFETDTPVPNSQLQPPLKSGTTSSEVSTQVQPGTPATAHTLKPALMPAQTSLAMSGTHTTDVNSWFTSGPDALPAIVRMDPNVVGVLQRYGAAPAAVQFSSGRR